MSTKLDKLTALNLAGGDLIKQVDAALSEYHKSKLKHGRDMSHSIQINIPLDDDIENDSIVKIKVQTTLTCKTKMTATGASWPAKIDSKGLYDANTQLEFPPA